MAISPEPMSRNPIDFRAPPPSPIASGRRSTVTNDDIFTEFLHHSLRVPDLALPDKAFPRQHFIESPPVIDFLSLDSKESDSIQKILVSLSGIGCFQLVNHGIPPETFGAASAAAAGLFHHVPLEKKAVVTRSLERLYGFEEGHGEEGESDELSEEFVWSCRDEDLKLRMEGIWPVGYSNFSEKMETLLLEIEKVAEKILQVLWENFLRKSVFGNDMILQQQLGSGSDSVCCVYKHRRNVPAGRWYDVIRMMMRGTDFSHTLCLHICDGSSEFQVYSKKGWISLSPEKGALIITVGDQIQALSGGHYKHVIGRPIFKDEKEDCISMAFLCSPPSSTTASYSKTSRGNRAISLSQQALVALILTFLYHFFVYIYKKF
ncbi:1-aminocyclopropane-1-carboxylate oxidase-like [Juglans microcarpa x Juglans regia]|uniref:1-aminocyclopropane-1-carboxylate oxidase-like n=1 Tax=Juglans microcarpa x Juglans regia TaxID=2249226 RepID=UPI001B7EC51D|nr:1-aminocyclopropane-1-carboxylate oxidase-like [Juglans microcarpa x Juglans regia]